MATTRWKDDESNDFNEILKLLEKKPKDEISHDKLHYVNWNIEKMLSINEQIEIDEKNIEFNLIQYKYDEIQPTRGLKEKISTKEVIIIPYFDGTNINYIINRNSDAQKILRKLLKYSGKNEIKKDMPELNKDFFIWLINKVYKNENEIKIHEEDNSIKLESIKGFKGDTEDLLTKVSANGESVMNIISTLSFFLESNNLTQIKLDLAYDQHFKIELTLNDQTIFVSEKAYTGAFEKNSNGMELIAKLNLLVYLKIIPRLFQAYRKDIENKEWNKEQYIIFLKKVAKELSDKVESRVEFLERNA